MSVDTTVVEGFRERRRLHPMTLLQRLIVSLPGLLILVFPLFGERDPRSWMYLILLALYGLVAVPLMVLQYLRFRYRITERELHIDSGVLTRRKRSIPIERIQNIEIERPLIARVSSTARVRVETAGSAGAEGVLELVSLETAYQLRDAIRVYQRALKEEDTDEISSPSEQPEHDVVLSAAVQPREEETLLFRLNLGRVLLSGVFRFSLVYIVLMFSGLEYLNVDVVDVFEWFERGPLHPLATFAAESPVAALLASLMAASLIAWLTGIIVNLNRYFRFELRQSGPKVLVKQGLATLHEAAIPLKRIQTFVLRTNPLMRRFGWWALDVQTIGLESSRRGRSGIVPFGQWEEVLGVLNRIEPIRMPDQFLPVSRRTIRRRFLRYTAVLVVGSAAASLVLEGTLWLLLATPFLLWLAYAQYKNHGYAVTPDHLIVRAGILRHQVWIVPHRKHQAFFATASPFQRRVGLATLQPDTAGAPPYRFPRVVDLPDGECDDRLAELVTTFRTLRNSSGRGGLLSPTLP